MKAGQLSSNTVETGFGPDAVKADDAARAVVRFQRTILEPKMVRSRCLDADMRKCRLIQEKVESLFLENADKQKFLAFYLAEEFWADSKPDYSQFSNEQRIVREFTPLLEEPIVEVTHGEREIRICRDGMIMYSDAELNSGYTYDGFLSRLEQYTEILNALYFLFASSLNEHHEIQKYHHYEVTHYDILPITIDISNRVCGHAIPLRSLMSGQINKRYLKDVPRLYEDNLDLYIESFPPRDVISRDTLAGISRMFLEMAPEDSTNIRLIARSNKAAAEYESTSFSDCIIIAWTEIEAYLFDSLRRQLQSMGESRFNHNRRRSLERQLHVAGVIEFLEALSVISIEEYGKLNTLRKYRNDIVHNNAHATEQQAQAALEFLEQILLVKTKTSIKFKSMFFAVLF